MQSKVKKVIYSDNGRDIAITGEIVEEDDFLLTIVNKQGRIYKLGKRTIVCIKEQDGNNDN